MTTTNKDPEVIVNWHYSDDPEVLRRWEEMWDELIDAARAKIARKKAEGAQK